MRMLVVSAAFGQEGRPCSHHVTDRVAELRRHGVAVDVLTEKPPKPPCEALVRDVGIHAVSHKPWKATAGTRAVQRLWTVATSPAAVARWVFGQAVGGRERFAHWEWPDRAVAYALGRLPLASYDLIYSTGGPASAHLAARRLARHARRPWVAEIQDPIIFDGVDRAPFNASRRDMGHLRRAEEALNACDALVCVTRTCRDYYRARLNKSEVHHIYPGASPAALSGAAAVPGNAASSRRLVFLHAGSLPRGRHVDIFGEAVQQRRLEERVELCLAGHADAGVIQAIRRYPEFVRHIGRLTRAEVAAAVASTDVCLVVQHTAPISALTIPSKLYEYGAYRASVLFLGYRNEEVLEMAGKLSFYCVDQAQPEAVAATLESLVEAGSGKLAKMTPVSAADAASEFLAVCGQAVAGLTTHGRSRHS